ncbi:MAG: DUF6527 family protein [Smithella sp.]|jgi:hypothetical protein
MKRIKTLTHEFAEHIPSDLEDGKIYVSVTFATAIHKCCCGCGQEVVTPISPTDWKLIFDGQSISLYPSIGNWSLPCQSHYWIERNMVKWAPKWSKDKINAVKAYDALNKEKYYSKVINQNDRDECENISVKATKNKAKKSFWEKLKCKD